MPRRIRPTVVHPLAVRELRVLRVADVTPALRRVTFTGEQLGAFEPTPGLRVPAFVSTGFDDDVRLLFPYPGETVPVLPVYQDGKLVQPTGQRPLGRYYTVRRYDPVARELDIEFVRHGVGVATTWAYRARPGDVLHLGGPSSSLGLPEGFDQLLVAGDETAAPAIARLLDELPVDARAHVYIEVEDVAHRLPLRELPGVTVTWLARAAGQSLPAAVRAADWGDDTTFAWVAGEQSVVRDLRRHLVEERGFPKAHIDFVGYWKRTEPLPDVEKAEEQAEKFHEQSELLPPLAIRLAIELGLGDLISRGVSTPAALAERTGTVEWALRKFLRYLETIGLLASAGDVFRLTESGQELAEDWVVQMLRPGGVHARLERGLLGLGESLRTGRASYDYEGLRADTDFEKAFLDDKAESGAYVAAPLVAGGAFEGCRHVVVHSDVAGAVAAALTEKDPKVRVTVVASPAQAAWLADDLPRTLGDPAQRERVTVAAAGEDADAVLLVERLARHADADAVRLLRQAAATLRPGGRLVVAEEVLDLDDLDDHDATTDLLHLTLHGSGHRTGKEVEALFATAGLTVAATDTLGWGDVQWTLTGSPEGTPPATR